MMRITLDGNFEHTVCQDLDALQDNLAENGIRTSKSTITVPGIKVELVTGLAIASLTVASISTLINVINFWKGQRPTVYRISFEMLDGNNLVPDNEAVPMVAEAFEKGRIRGIRIEKI